MILEIRGDIVILIPLSGENQKICEEKHLKLMAKLLPFYPSEIYGEPREEDYSLNKEKIDSIMNARKKIWKHKKLYNFMYLGSEEEKRPPKYKAPEIRVYNDRLRQILVGKSGDMTQGSRRRKLEEIIDIIGQEKRGKDLKKIFNYEALSKSNEEKHILTMLGVDVCPYCNRAFTITVPKEYSEKNGVRPQLDHYFPQSLYPYLAVNFYNLIPSCGSCNQYKAHKDTRIEPILYPYDEGLGTEYRFVTYPENGDFGYLRGQDTGGNFSLHIEPIVREIRKSGMNVQERVEFEKRICGSIKSLHLGELYNAHTNYAQIILRNGYIFNIEYLETLRKAVPLAEFSLSDIKTMVYCQDIQQTQWHKNILSKMKNDLDYELMG